ncbi:hypothetical protein [Rhodopirellula sp. MGV]|uniref:hypothetical protein n=1 Tax=Rhodopirellula sp. MGV TaxID=2023130 RepID=UPI000B96DFC2|nr:hypothetical protein [Rhodopirellula sp. MGV]OYP37691.1 hypothetical protein CGZ80_04190 [Rhodopirellula sp. MGV]PNY37129.1 hypothetical protein C2E31_09045 [Rhodopirellula baltica]
MNSAAIQIRPAKRFRPNAFTLGLLCCAAVFAGLASAASPPCCDQSQASTCRAVTGERWPISEPIGTLYRRVPYETLRIDYYHRPYSPHTVHEHYAQPRPVDVKQPYQTSQLQSIYESVEQSVVYSESNSFRKRAIDAMNDVLKQDRPLEFVDWKAHEKARLQWEREHEPLSANVHAMNPSSSETLKATGQPELILGTKIRLHDARNQTQ